MADRQQIWTATSYIIRNTEDFTGKETEPKLLVALPARTTSPAAA